MILCICDAADKVLAKTDVTGLLWVSAHNGFVNQSEIALHVVLRGKPSHGWLEDLMGTKITHIQLTNAQPYVDRFTILTFAPRSLSINLILPVMAPAP